MTKSARRMRQRASRRLQRDIRYRRSNKRRPGKVATYKQGRVKKTTYGKDAKGESLAKQGIHPNKKSEKVVRGAKNQKRPSASYYYNVLKKPVGSKIYYRPKKSGKQVLHVLQVRDNGVPYWKAQK
jgi:hypothetical protein|uniref:Uncharacterized protein n=1 Tax=viral metagenome TaxID=1070528 RepID=A0A6C0F593_9ZZZZ